MTTCNQCDEPLIPGKDWSENYQLRNHYIHNSCDTKLVKSRPSYHNRHYCTVEKIDGTTEDWVINQKNDLAPYTEGGIGVVVNDWHQTMPEGGWPKRTELLGGVLAKSNGRPTLQTCGGECGETKPTTAFGKDNNRKNNGCLRKECRDCGTRNMKGTNVVIQRVCDRLGLTGGNHKTDNMTGWRDYDLDQHKVWIAEQTEIDEKEANQQEPVEPNKQDTSPPEPKRPTRKRPTKKQRVPPVRWGRSPERDRWHAEAARNMLRKNKNVDHDACELSDFGPFNATQFCHTFHVKDCKKVGEYDWIRDDNNGFLLWEALNPPMNRGYHWKMIGDRAFYVPPEGEDYYWWMVELDIPKMFIVPTPEQVKYILRANEFAIWGFIHD